jgi:hypothetical protein
MELNRIVSLPCPLGIIAVAINGENDAPHCGILYTSTAGAVRLCDMQYEHQLGVRPPPNYYLWTEVRLDDEEVLQVSAFVEMIIEQHQTNPLPYSFLYSPNGIDVTGRICRGAGVTCATFIANVFEGLRLKLVDLGTWRPRPKQDLAFRQRIINYAIENGHLRLADRLSAEEIGFRLKPWEVYGSATLSRHPVKFVQAQKLAKTVAKLVRKLA